MCLVRQILIAFLPILQDGYDVRILGGADNGSTSAVHIGLRSTSNHDSPAVPRQDKDGYAPPYSQFTDSPRKIPFWRTTRGKVLLAILAVVILGAAIGGGVGGALGGKHNSGASDGSTPSGGSDGSGGQGGSDTNQGTSPQSAAGGNVASVSSRSLR